MTPSPSCRASRTFHHRIAAPPERIFPLLCPVREGDWIEGWQAEVRCSESGLAEDHCVFETDFPGRGRATWVVSRYEPPRRIGFSIFVAGCYVERLDVEVAPDGEGGSALSWTRTYPALSEAGAALLPDLAGPALGERMARLERSLAHYLAAGTCLRAPWG